MRNRTLISLAAAVAIGITPVAFAAEGHDSHHASATTPAIQGQGTVKAVKGATINLSHGPIPALKWPAMTMDFRLKDPALAKGLKPGDTVVFGLERSAGGYVINAIEARAN